MPLSYFLHQHFMGYPSSISALLSSSSFLSHTYCCHCRGGPWLPYWTFWHSPLLSHDTDSETLSCWVQSTRLDGYAHSTGGNITRPLSVRGIWTERTYRCACVTSVEHILHIRSHKQVGGIWSRSEWWIQVIKTAEKETSGSLMFLMFSWVIMSKSVRLRHGLI